jgi:hypothetical protein
MMTTNSHTTVINLLATKYSYTTVIQLMATNSHTTAINMLATDTVTLL